MDVFYSVGVGYMSVKVIYWLKDKNMYRVGMHNGRHSYRVGMIMSAKQ